MTTTRFTTRHPAIATPPGSVRTATNILYVIIAVALISPIVFLAVTALSMVRGNGDPLDRDLTLVLGMAAAAVVVGWFILMLTRRARRGRRWAWKTLLVLLAFVAFVGALVMTSIANGAATGLVMLAIPLVLIGLLLGRNARAYYSRRDRLSR